MMPSTNTTTLLDAALYYAGLGYPVFPCVPNGKAPLTKRGFKDATTDQAQIETWWEQTPTANIGIATAGLIVIDVDGTDNQWPNDADKSLSLMKAPMAITPRGGRHYVFRRPEGKEWRCTANELAKDVDTRTDGGYILVAPSRVENLYHWLEGNELECSPDKLPEPPEWLVGDLDRVASGEVLAAPTPSSDANVIPSGQRNHTLASLAGAMRRVGMGSAEIRAALTEANNLRCQPPLPPREVEKIVTSICRYEPDQIAVAVTENHFAQDHETEPTPKSETPDPGQMPEELLHIPGFVGDVMQFSLTTAPYPNRVLAFGGALALQAHLAGRKVRDPGDNRTNLYILGLAYSAAGKDWPRKVNTRILHEIGLSEGLGDRFASGEGLQDALRVTPAMLFQTDEIDGLLQSINKANDARHENILGALLTLYSTSNSIWGMRRKAGKEPAGSIDQPCLTVFGTAIPNHYYQALSDRMLSNGFFGRMLILESAKRGNGQEPVIRDIPQEIIDTAKWWADFQPGKGNLETWHPKPLTVEHTDEAKQILIAAREESEVIYQEAEDKHDTVGTTVWGRISEQTRKLALIYAISENHLQPKIDVPAAEWAAAFVMHQTRRMLFMAESHVADNPFHADCLKLMEKLRKAPDRTMTHSQLLKRMKTDSQTFQKLVSTMTQQGDIVVSQNKTAGRTGVSYRLAGE